MTQNGVLRNIFVTDRPTEVKYKDGIWIVRSFTVCILPLVFTRLNKIGSTYNVILR